MRNGLMAAIMGAGLGAVLVLAAGGVAGAQDSRMAPSVFYAHIRTVLDHRASLAQQRDSTPLLNAMVPNNDQPLAPGDSRTLCYFDFGNTEKFLALAAKGTKSVVVDPGYLTDRFGGVQAAYQNLNTMSRVLQNLEARYKGHLILMQELRPAGTVDAVDSTLIHEAIHSAAFAAGRMDLDQDGPGHGAPEYISGEFFEHQRRLLSYEKEAFEQIGPLMAQMVALQTSKASDDEKRIGASRLIRDMFFVADGYLQKVKRIYRSEFENNIMKFNWSEVSQMMAYWDGKADWQRLMRDVEANVAYLQVVGRAAEQDIALEDDAGKRFLDFFFRKPCKSG